MRAAAKSVGRAHAVLEEAPRIHATCRALGRSMQAMSRDGAARTGWRRAAVAGCAVADVLIWQAMRRKSMPLWARLAIDVVDVAFWAGVSDSGLVSSLASQIAVELEAGTTWGLAGFSVPVVEAGASTLARRLTGRTPEPGVHVPHLGAVFAGLSVRWREHSRLGGPREEHAAELSAKSVRAFLAGQNSVAMGASSVVDMLTPVAMMLDAAGAGSALAEVRSGWKTSVAEQTARHAMYLDQSLRLWQEAHNDHPDLSRDVFVTVAEGDGTTLLTSYQSDALARTLEALDLRGEVRVSLRDTRRSDERRPGRPFELLVAGRAVLVPADPGVGIVPFNPTPLVMLFGGWAALMPIRKRDGAVPPAWAGISSVLYLLAAARFVGREAGSTSDTWAVPVLMAVAQGAIDGRSARVRRNSAGAHLFHGTFGIAPAALIVSAGWSRMSVGQRRAAIGSLLGVAAGAYAIAEKPKSLLDLACALASPAAALVGGTGVTNAISRQTEVVREELSAEDDAIETASFEEGRQSVIGLVREALGEAGDLFASRNDLAPEVRANIELRLAVINELAAELGIHAISAD